MKSIDMIVLVILIALIIVPPIGWYFVGGIYWFIGWVLLVILGLAG